MALFLAISAIATALPETSLLAASISPQSFVNQHCLDCHNHDDKAAGLVLDVGDIEDFSKHAALWEQIVRKLQARQMPPLEHARPTEDAYKTLLAFVEPKLDAVAAERPHPGRTPTFRRLNRTEYQNAIHDLLALEIDTSTLLPADDASHGFDNVAVEDLSPTLLERYVSAAQKISRLAVGGALSAPAVDTFRIRPDRTQEEHVEGLPLGTRGGTLISFNFPQTGDYEIQIRLMRDRNEEVEGLKEPHELEVLLDRAFVKSFSLLPPKEQRDHQTVDEALKVRLPVAAGPHQIGVTFPKKYSSLEETRRQPYHAHFNMHRHPRLSPAVYQVTISGPYAATSPGETLSRGRIFICRPDSVGDEETCAKKILSALLRRAYRRPIVDADLVQPMKLFAAGRREQDFEAGIQMALSGVLVSPQFLFRVERDPAGLAPGTSYQISPLDLASRLSFFLWSSIPDDELLDLAAQDKLRESGVLETQVKRMLADPRSKSLASNFAGQWLHLRNLDSITPDLRMFPDFDDNLRQAFRRESELLFESLVREDRSVLELLCSDQTFLNERLAKHYDVPHVYGSHFRRIPLSDIDQRGGLLRHGSVLTVTSYATRTSPVIRGKWILENFFGTPPPPPPANVPALKDNTVANSLSVRERLAEHRSNVACASCHRLMDPVGFSLENFDAVGRWRTMENNQPVDAAGGLPDGKQFVGVGGLEQAILDRPELFVRTLTEKLMTYALGRGLEPLDGSAIRKVVRDSREKNYSFSAVILGIVKSKPFQMRISE